MLPHSCRGGWIHIAIPSLNYASKGIYTAEYIGCPKKVNFRQSCHKYCPKCCHIHAGGWIHIALLSPNQATEGIYTTEYMKTKQRQIFANLPKYSPSFCMRARQTSSYSPGTLLNLIGCRRFSWPRPHQELLIYCSR